MSARAGSRDHCTHFNDGACICPALPHGLRLPRSTPRKVPADGLPSNGIAVARDVMLEPGCAFNQIRHLMASMDRRVGTA
jgi:hypothetical protein